MTEPTQVSALSTALARTTFDAHPLVSSLAASTRDAIWSCARVRVFEPGAALTREGDPVLFYWMLISGTVRVSYTSPDGLEVTVKIFAAPAAWAEMQILTHHHHTENAFCVETASCLCIPAEAFVLLLDAHPLFMKAVLLDTSARFLIAAQNERALAFLGVPDRLAHLLLSYVRVYGVQTDSGTRIRTRLSHEQLAADLGVVKKSITRTLSQWTEEGVVAKEGQYYVVVDLAALVERAPKQLIGVDWSTGSSVQDRSVDDTATGPTKTRLRAPKSVGR